MQRFSAVQPQAAANWGLDPFAALVTQPPGLFLVAAAEQQSLVPGERLDGMRFATGGEVGGGGAQQGAIPGEGSGHQPGIRRRDADPYCQIKSFFHDIRQAIGKTDLHLHLRPGDEKFRHQRQQDPSAEGGRGGQPQHSACGALVAGDAGLGVVDRSEDLQATSIKLSSLVGQAKRTRGAMQQPHAQPLLQTRDGLARRRTRQPHRLSAGDKTAGIDDGHENLNVIEIRP